MHGKCAMYIFAESNRIMAKEIKIQSKYKITKDVVQTVQLLAEDNSIQLVADALKINKRTLDARIILIKKECGVKTLHGLVALFFRNKLIK